MTHKLLSVVVVAFVVVVGCCESPIAHNNEMEIGNGVAMSLIEAVKWYRKAADLGEPFAQAYLGCCCRDGTNGVTQDYKQAFDLFDKAAVQGHVGAMACLGSAYEDGIFFTIQATFQIVLY
jgi:hypothetical protein